MAGGISEKIHVRINGLEQGMFVKGTRPHNPVLLFLHGGPGMPMYWMTRRHPIDIYENFTVAWWEQRGAGLSYDPEIPPETMVTSQFIDDTLEVSRYLLDRFHKDKLYLMGHSWGSYIGVQAVAKAPELYHAYIGVGQLTHQIESEQLAYMHKSGIGTTREMRSVITGLFLPSLSFSEYTLMEKVNLWRGKLFSRRDAFGLWNTMLMTDLRREVRRVEVPVYFLHGRYDYTCAYSLAKDYFDKLDVPAKGFYTFENSAHSPMIEEPERTVTILRNDVMEGKTSLADL